MKKKFKLWPLLILGIILILVNTGQTVVILKAGERRHKEQMNVQDSVNARYQYVIDYHFEYCKFDPNEKYKPFK